MHRRRFLNNILTATPSLLFLPTILQCRPINPLSSGHKKINELAINLLKKWCQGLVDHQTNSPDNLITHGGIYSPGDDAYLGRSADAIYPLLWMAKFTNDTKYIEAAKMVYDWEQHNCWSEELGCWFNRPNMPNSWKGITVFAAMTKYEAIMYYPELLGEETVKEWRSRLYRASEYLYKTLNINYGNINYPAVGTLAFYCFGKLFNEDRYIKKAEELADGMLAFFTPDDLFYGEGGRIENPNGQYPIDLGYNVEESIPAMALYSKMAGHNELYTKILKSMRMHLEFMLPNGGWDNSWGTRSFKWTLWGSRTSDGCHAGYFALADEEPVFAEAVYRNLKCLEASTSNNLLHSGPHEFIEGISPSMHHTFNHAKALVNLLHTEAPDIPFSDNVLPREKVYGTKKIDSINTVLFSKGSWRGTVTAYNIDYRDNNNGHASGGALTLLYHMQNEIVSAASMTEYQRWEESNMLDEKPMENFMNLTPRLELTTSDNRIYRNISDRNAELTTTDSDNEIIVSTVSRLVDGDNIAPEEGSPNIFINYKIKNDIFSMEITLDKPILKGKLSFIFPVVCSGQDEISIVDNTFKRKNNNGVLTIKSNYHLATLLPENRRIYNFIPGLQAFPLIIDCSGIDKEMLVLNFSV